MKRIMIFTLSLILIAVPSLADLAEAVEGHNRGCLASGATEITGQPTIKDNHYIYQVSDHVNVHFSMDGDEIKSFSCVCLDESGVGEFLAQCVASFYNMGDLMAYVYCHDPVLSDFLDARSGREPKSNSSVNGLLFQMVKESYGYTFIIVKVK